MEKYNKLLRNIAELIEKGLFTSKDLKKGVEDSLKLKMEIIANKLNTWVASLSPSIITIMIGGFFVIHFEKTN